MLLPRRATSSTLVAIIVALVFSIGLAVRLPQLTESLWFDEWLRTLGNLQGENGRRLLLHDVHNPLYNATIWVWVRLFGDSEPVLRLPSLFAVFVAGGFVLDYAKRRSDLIGGHVGLWSIALWWVTAPVLVWYSCEAKNNAFVLMMSAAVLWACDRVGRQDRPASHAESQVLSGLWAACAVCIFAIWTDWVTLIAMVPAVCFMVLRCGRAFAGRGLASHWVAPLAVLALAVSPLVVWKAIHVSDLTRNYLTAFTPWLGVRLLCTHFTGIDAIWPREVQRNDACWLVAAVLLPILCIGAARLWRGAADGKSGAPARELIVMTVGMLSVFLLGSFLVTALRPNGEWNFYQPRNMLILLIPFVLFVAAGLGMVARDRTRGLMWAWMIAINVVGSVSMVTVLKERPSIMAPNPNWRAIAAEIRTVVPNGAIAVIGPCLPQPVERYDPLRTTRGVFVMGDEPTQKMTTDWIALRESGHIKEELFVMSDRFTLPLSDEMEAWLDARAWERGEVGVITWWWIAHKKH
jgi:hypothetical protein